MASFAVSNDYHEVSRHSFDLLCKYVLKYIYQNTVMNFLGLKHQENFKKGKYWKEEFGEEIVVNELMTELGA